MHDDCYLLAGSPQSAPVDSKALEETREAMKELQEEFSVYRKEKGENERLLDQQLEKFRKDVSEMRVQNARLASQVSVGDDGEVIVLC